MLVRWWGPGQRCQTAYVTGYENKKSPADLAKSAWLFSACSSYLCLGETPLRSEAVQLGWIGCTAAHAQSWVWDYFVWSSVWSGMEALYRLKHAIQASDFSKFWPCVCPLFSLLDLSSLGHFIFLLADTVLIFLLKAEAKVQQDL